jgi:putative RNA 2'-phosphotransferase
VGVADLLPALAAHGLPLTDQQLTDAAAAGTKRRFELADGRIRAVHGHSVDVDLQSTPAPPPAVLFHGTTRRALAGIVREGITPRSRRHVHLSSDIAMARDVASRHGRDVVVLAVDAAALAGGGQVFFPSSSGVWLTTTVPAAALRELPGT